MISTIYDRGMIFLCKDKCPKREATPMKHNYLIIGFNGDAELGLVQTMSITSMRSKEVKMEVPIKLCNDYVSYIVPYNLHSFSINELTIDNYKGCLVDTPRISKNEFLNLLMDIYMASIGLRNLPEVKERYDKYCENFWKEFSDCKEFRELEEEQKNRFARPKYDTDISENEISEILSSVVGNTTEEIQVEEPSTFRNRNKGRKSKKGPKHVHNKHKKSRRDDIRVEKLMRETIGSSAEELTRIPHSQSISPFYTGIRLEDLTVLKKAPRMVRNWTNNDLVLFIRGYKEYGYAQIHTIIPDRWSSASAMSHYYKSVKEEAEKRKLKIAIDPLKRPMREWSDKDLQNYLAVMNNHRFDTEFQLQYTGFENLNQCNTLTYNVKKEMQTRGLV